MKDTEANKPVRYLTQKDDPMVRLAAPLKEKLEKMSNDGDDLRFAGRPLSQIVGLLVHYGLQHLELVPDDNECRPAGKAKA